MNTKNTKPMSSHSASTEKSRQRIKHLFAQFTVVYGNLWQSQFNQEALIQLAEKEWGHTLASVSDEHLACAVSECKKHFKMPPTLPMFYELCSSFQAEKPINYFQIIKNELIEAELDCAHWQKIIAITHETAVLNNILHNAQKKLEETREKYKNYL